MVVQFPGLGGYVPGILAKLADDAPEHARLLEQLDAVGREYGLSPVSRVLTDLDAPAIEELALTPTLLHLAALGASACLYGALAGQGRRGDALLGHSTGELTALAMAGCMSVADAARVLCEREVALAEGDFLGGLTAVRISAGRAAHLC